MVQGTLVGLSPASNPDRMQIAVVFSGNYGVNGVGDQINLAPYDSVNNPLGVKNPNGLALPEMPVSLDFCPTIEAEATGGYYCQPNPLLPGAPIQGVAQGINLKTGAFLRQFAPNGTELATNAAYNVAVTAAGTGILIEVILPKTQ